MKKGYTINNVEKSKSDNAILVSNYHGENEIMNFPIELNDLHDYKSKSDIGIWRIKQLKTE